MEFEKNINYWTAIFNRINWVKCNKVQDLEKGQKCYVNGLDCVKIAYGDHIVVVVDDDLKIFLPVSWADTISDHDVSLNLTAYLVLHSVSRAHSFA